MRRYLNKIVALVLAVGLAWGAAGSAVAAEGGLPLEGRAKTMAATAETLPAAQVGDELLVAFVAGTTRADADALLLEAGCHVAYELGVVEGALVLCAETADGQPVEAAITRLEALPVVAHAQPNYLYPLIEDDTAPAEGLGETGDPTTTPEDAGVAGPELPAVGPEGDGPAGQMDEADEEADAIKPEVAGEGGPQATVDDPEADAAKQWHLYKTNTLAAWDVVDAVPGTAGKTRVALLDTTIQLDHPDLADNLLPALAADFSSGEQQPYGSLPPDSHGTHVAGLMAARSNNGLGVAGMATGSRNQAVELLPVNVFRRGSGGGLTASTSAMVAGLRYALAAGADVINMSLGYFRLGSMNNYDRLLESMVDEAAAAGVPVVCAAGNNTAGGRDTLFLPSDFDKALGVIALDVGDARSYSSNYGDTKFIAAPGAGLHSTVLAGQYGAKSGTSMAAPVVSSVAAMMLYVNPWLSYADVVDILAGTAVDLYTADYPPGKDAQSGWGRVDAAAAVAAAQARPGVPAVVQQVAISVGAVDLQVGAQQQLLAAARPRNAVGGSITWRSGDAAVATVDADGLVTATGPGQVTIEAVAGGQVAVCTVVVTQPASGVMLDETEKVMKPGQGVHLTATVAPENASDRRVKWHSSVPAVASVTAAGYVQALAEGSTVITATTMDGGFAASCTVTVEPAETGRILAAVTHYDGSTPVGWTIDAKMASFVRLEVAGADGVPQTLTENRDYLRSEGSVVLVLSAGYLAGLPNGAYRMDAVFAFGTVSDAFTVAVPESSVSQPVSSGEGSVPPESGSGSVSQSESQSGPQSVPDTGGPSAPASPQTGDAANLGLWIILAVVAVGVLAAVGLVLWRQRRPK